MTGVILYLALPQVFLYCLLATLVCFSQEKRVICLSGPVLLFPVAITCNLSCLVRITSLSITVK